MHACRRPPSPKHWGQSCSIVVPENINLRHCKTIMMYAQHLQSHQGTPIPPKNTFRWSHRGGLRVVMISKLNTYRQLQLTSQKKYTHHRSCRQSTGADPGPPVEGVLGKTNCARIFFLPITKPRPHNCREARLTAIKHGEVGGTRRLTPTDRFYQSDSVVKCISVRSFLVRRGYQSQLLRPMSMEACMLSLLRGVLEHPEHPPVSAPVEYSYNRKSNFNIMQDLQYSTSFIPMPILKLGGNLGDKASIVEL